MTMSNLSYGERTANPLVNMARAWNRFWFTPADPILLGLIRICCGLITLYVHLAYTGDLKEFFAHDAWVDTASINEVRQNMPWAPEPWDWKTLPQKLKLATPKAQPEKPTTAQLRYMEIWRANPEQSDLTVYRGYWAFSFWYHIGSVPWLWIVHAGVLVVMLLFTIGFCTRLTAVLTWLAALSYIQRAPTTLFGQDTMMNILLLYLMIGPSGAALSVDRLLQRWAELRRARQAGDPEPAWTAPQPLVSANVALRLIQVNLCLIYLMSGLSKLHGTTWWKGTALWLAQANFEFAPLWFAPYEAYLRLLCDHRWLWEVMMSGGVIFTFAIEVGYPFLVWNRRLRPYMVAGALVMHTGIALTMGLRTFSMMMMIMNIAFLPAPVTSMFLATVGQRVRQMVTPRTASAET